MITLAQLQAAIAYLLSCRPSQYVPWYSGYVSYGDGPPAWGYNAAAPAPETVQAQGGFCAAAVSLVLRYLGLTIPNPDNDEYDDGGIESYWDAYYPVSEWFAWGVDYPDGTLVMAPYGGSDLSAQGHVGIIWHYNGVMYVIEWIFNGGLVWDYTLEESDAWGHYQIAIRPERWLPLGESPKPEPVVIPTTYPGDTATPLEMAAWMSGVTTREFSMVPGILPVMTSCVELRAAWEGPGDVKDVPGYLPPPMDGTSLGWFQQQVGIYSDVDTPNIAVTQEQVLDPEWSLRSFLRWAKEYSDEKWNERTTDPYELGAWINAAQNSGFPDAYANVGYPLAKSLLDQIPTTQGDEMAFAKYTFVAAQGDHVAVDVTNAAVATLEASDVDCLAFSGADNIKMAGDAALAVADGGKLNCLVVGQKAHDALSGDAQAKAGWVEGGVVWALYGDSDAATLKRVRDWAISWIAKYEGKDTTKVQAIFDGVLMAIDSKKYGDLLAEAEQGNHPDPPQPPDPSLEQKVNIMWSEYQKEHKT